METDEWKCNFSRTPTMGSKLEPGRAAVLEESTGSPQAADAAVLKKAAKLRAACDLRPRLQVSSAAVNAGLCGRRAKTAVEPAVCCSKELSATRRRPSILDMQDLLARARKHESNSAKPHSRCGSLDKRTMCKHQFKTIVNTEYVLTLA